MAPLSALTTLLLLRLTTAQTTTLTLPFFGYDGTEFAASIVSATPSATVLALACQSPECGLFPYQTLTYGPSTYHMDMSVDGDGFTMTQDCVLEASQAVCVESASGSEANSPGKSTETYSAEASGGADVVVTEGADKLGASATGAGTPTRVGVTPTASAGSGVSQTGASPTPSTGSSSAVAGEASGSPTNAAVINGGALRGGLIGAAAGLVGGLLL